MGTLVRVEIDPQYRTLAMERGYDVEPFAAELIAYNQPWMFWCRVLPLTGKHAAVLELPPMFKLKVQGDS